MKTPSFGPIILMAAMYMNRGPVLMNMHIIYVECCQFERDILTKKKKRAIVCMAAIRYIGLIRLVPTYIQYVAIRNTCTKFLIPLKLRGWYTLALSRRRYAPARVKAFNMPKVAFLSAYFIQLKSVPKTSTFNPLYKASATSATSGNMVLHRRVCCWLFCVFMT